MGKFSYSLIFLWMMLGKTYGSCGVWKSTSYNIMEQEASSDEFPWQVFLKPDTGGICSGTIIGEFWILSNFQCFNEMTTTILMEAGKLNIGFQGTVYPIRKLIRHADYNGESLNNTIALLETSEPIMFNDMVLPACYPDDELLDVDLLVNCWVTTMKERTQDGSDNTASVLKKIQFIPVQPCHFNNLTAIICATARNAESSDCTVNSGDALMCQYGENEAWIVVGTAAIEKTECNTTVVFARTASYITWLRESTEIEGKPIIPEINRADLAEETSKKEDLVNYTVYFSEDIPSTESKENPELRSTPNKMSYNEEFPSTEVKENPAFTSTPNKVYYNEEFPSSEVKENPAFTSTPNKVYYNEEFISTESEENQVFRTTADKERRLEAGKMITLSLFYTQAFLVIVIT